jgi:hypothetical protein
MPNPHPLIDPLRSALQERTEAQSIRSIADHCGIDYRRLLAFSQGGLPEFDVLDMDRLAACLGMRLTLEVSAEAKQPPRAKAR